ncbi:TPA: hypothetical protein ACTYCW_004774 [Escherichia coli]
MGEQITNAEWEKISPDNFETASLLRAVDAIDDLRGDFSDGEYSAPPQIRTDLLRLHEIAMAVINEGSRRGGKREPQKIPPFRIVEFFGGVVRGMTTRQRLPHLSEALWRDAETPGNSATPVPGPQ